MNEESGALLSSTILVHKLSMNAPVVRAGELAVLQRFLAKGGSILLACHGWLWIQEPGRLLSNLPCNQIAQTVGIAVTPISQQAPYLFDGGPFSARDITLDGSQAFSTLITLDGASLVRDSNKATVGVVHDAGRNRVVAFGHDQPLSGEFLRHPPNRAYRKPSSAGSRPSPRLINRFA